MDDLEVYFNLIYRTMLAVIRKSGSKSYLASSADVHIHHKRLIECIVLENDGKKYAIHPFMGFKENFMELMED